MTDIILKKIELQNFRTHKKLTVEIANQAITNITGSNGSGKSSIVNAVPWALYGTRPNGVRKNGELRRENTPKEEPTTVSVTYSTGGKTYKVTRTMNYRSTVQCDLYQIEEDGTERHLAGPSVKSAQEGILKTIGVSPTVFLATAFFRQKDTDAFIDAKPEVRRSIFEELAGITANSHALEECRINRLANKRELDSKTVDRAGIEAHQKTLAELTEAEKTLAEKLSTLRSTYRTLNNEKKQQSLKVEEMRKHYTVRTNAEARLEAIEERIKDAKETAANAKEQADLISQRIQKAGGEAINFGTVEAMYRDKLESLNAIRAQLVMRNNALATAEARLEEAQEYIDSMGGIELKDAEETLKAAQDKLQQVDQEILTLNGELAAISQAKLPETRSTLEQIESIDGTCPTCDQVIKDKDKIVGAMRESIRLLESEKNNLTQSLQEKTTLATKLREEIQNSQELIRKHQIVSSETETIAEVRKAISKAQKRLTQAETAYDTANTVYQDAKQVESLSRELENYNSMRARALNATQTLNNEATQCKETLKVTPNVSEHALNLEEKKLSKLDEGIATNVAKGYEISATHTETKTKQVALQAQVAKELEEAKAYESLLQEKELILTVEKALKEFRADIGAEALPSLTKYASELIAGFTNGKIIGVTVTEDFNVYAHFSSGETREASLLSGGELSAVSLAIGLSMSKVFGGSSGALILDEAFTAYDANNLEATVKTIRGAMGAQQIIIIAHNDTVDAVSDYHIRL